MNADEIRQKSIVEYLSKMGHKPSPKTSGKYWWFNSPLRTEGNPSFTVNKATNKWQDRGTGKHGSIIDLVMELENKTFIEACNFLSADNISIKKYQPISVPKCSIDIIEVNDLTDERLLDYMRGRKISDKISKMYCKEIYYYYVKENVNDQKVLSGIGFKNNMGGYEIRSSFDKTSTPPPSFSKIKGDSERYVLFEGFISFLSALEHYKIEKFKYDTYILNGVGRMNLLLPFLKEKTGYFYTDNDKPGDDVIKDLKGRDMRDTYKGYNDFNDLLCKKKIS